MHLCRSIFTFCTIWTLVYLWLLCTWLFLLSHLTFWLFRFCFLFLLFLLWFWFFLLLLLLVNFFLLFGLFLFWRRRQSYHSLLVHFLRFFYRFTRCKSDIISKLNLILRLPSWFLDISEPKGIIANNKQLIHIFDLCLYNSLRCNSKLSHIGHKTIDPNIGIIIRIFPKKVKDIFLKRINISINLYIKNNIISMIN